MKKLITTIFAGMVFFGGTAIADEIKLPERFQNYKTKGKITSEGVVQTGVKLFVRKDYDLNGDGKHDVSEIKTIIGIKDNTYIHLQNPINYWFDLNDNGKIETNEVISDENQDGWNGNEKWYIPRTEPKKNLK